VQAYFVKSHSHLTQLRSPRDNTTPGRQNSSLSSAVGQ